MWQGFFYKGSSITFAEASRHLPNTTHLFTNIGKHFFPVLQKQKQCISYRLPQNPEAYSMVFRFGIFMISE